MIIYSQIFPLVFKTQVHHTSTLSERKQKAERTSNEETDEGLDPREDEMRNTSGASGQEEEKVPTRVKEGNWKRM